MRIIYIAGDGRSGSTVLDAIFGNANDSISIGEGYRFWNRYYTADTLCGCSEKIESCILWGTIHKRLTTEFPSYNHDDISKRIQYLLKFRNIRRIPDLISLPDWKFFCTIVRRFYELIAEESKANIIIDSSKNCGWLKLLIALEIEELKVVYLERNLEGVANSWKKKKRLPEYYDRVEYMPVKSTFLSLKSWLKVKYSFFKLKDQTDYMLIRYEKFIADPRFYLDELNQFLKIDLSFENLEYKFNHGIGGNPVRSEFNKELIIKVKPEKLINLSVFEFLILYSINKISKWIL